MPRNVEFLVSETYSWFSHSTLRQEKYRDLFKVIEVDEEPLKILKLCDTRWLSISPCVDRIISQFDVLKLHFQLAAEGERCYRAQILYDMYRDPVNKLYLLFLQPHLANLNRVNKLFQSDTASPVRLQEELMTLYVSILQKVIRHQYVFPNWSAILEFDLTKDDNYLPIQAIHFGPKFHMEAVRASLPQDVFNLIIQRCFNYLKELLSEMKKRLPTNAKHLEDLNKLSPTVVLARVRPTLQDLGFLPLFTGDLNVLEQQWGMISAIHWENRDETDINGFWIEVHNYKDAAGEQVFRELAKFALSLLSLPLSNASVERSFSQMNLVKDRSRNRMKQPMLEAILHIRAHMSRSNICCNKFQPTNAMLARVNISMYDNVDEQALPDTV